MKQKLSYGVSVKMSINLLLRINLNEYLISVSSFLAEGFNKYKEYSSISRDDALKRNKLLKSLENLLELAWTTESLVFNLSAGHKSLLATH